VPEYASASSHDPSSNAARNALASTTTSENARLSPFAPVGGTMWAASPARNSRPCRIGPATKLRIAVTDLSVILPSPTDQPSSAKRFCSSVQIRSSGHPSTGSSGATCR